MERTKSQIMKFHSPFLAIIASVSAVHGCYIFPKGICDFVTDDVFVQLKVTLDKKKLFD